MSKLIRYLKPYLVYLVLIIALLFGQANADLALPGYMSKIVNIGIQQGGVEDSVPSAIRQTQVEKAFFFLTKEEQDTVSVAYDRVDPDSPGYADTIKKYPKANGESLLVLKKIDASQRAKLNGIMRKALSIVQLVTQAAADPAKAGQMGGGMAIDLSRLPPGTDLFSALKMMPEDQRSAIVASIQQKVSGMDSSLLEQTGISAVRKEYEQLGSDVGKVQNAYILSTGGIMLLLSLSSVLAAILTGFLSSRMAAGVARNLRKDFFAKVEGFSFAEFDKFSTASLITRSTNDISQIQMLLSIGLRMVFYAPITGIGGVIRATSTASSMSWIIALFVVILLVIIGTVFSLVLPKFKNIQKLVDKLNLVVRENLSGMMVIRAFTRQKHEEERFDKANKDVTGTMLYVTRIMAVLMPLMMLVMNFSSLLIIWTGAHEVAAMKIQIGDMMAFMQYSMQIFSAFSMISMMFIILPRASVSANRIAEVLATESEIKDPERPRSLSEGCKGIVEFKDVSFRYPGANEDVLHKISFAAKPGQTTAIIGTTGAGKSTLVSLIPRFYDVSEGSITIDGVDIRELSQHELREKIGFVPQRASLFSGTIESNLRYANEEASEEDLASVLAVSQAKEFVDAKPEGIEAEIAQGGINVSGGQRQRLTIARALIKKASVYIFDDSFSALDFKTDTKLRQALKPYVSHSSVFLVTQRVATIKQADQIIVLDEGKIVGLGTHHELMETSEVYRDIALSQLKQEELA